MGFFQRLKQAIIGRKDERTAMYEKGLASSRKSFKDQMTLLFANHKHLDANFYADLLDTLIETDMGASLANAIVNETKDQAIIQKIVEPAKIYEVLIKQMRDFYLADLDVPSEINYASEGPTVILMVGVNGVGKTTTIAKLTNLIQKSGKKVLLVAGDTFRAGAVEQLSVWAKRTKTDLLQGKENSDPSSVIYDGLKKGLDENYDVIICDTAGRLQTKINLMNELDKIKRVMQKLIKAAPHESLLVIDATMGQNGVLQAEAFASVTQITGIVLTKMDSSSKGGIILAIKHKLNIPVRYIGLGEKLDDMIKFDLDQYLWGLVKEGGNENE